MRTIPINFQPSKSIVWTIPFNCKRQKSLFVQFLLIGSTRNQLFRQFQPIDSTRNQLSGQFQLVDQHPISIVWTIPINWQSSRSFFQTIPIHRQHSKPIVHTIPINRWSPKSIVWTIPINRQSPKSIVWIPINRQSPKSIIWTIPINRQSPKSIVWTIPINTDNRRNQLPGQFQLMDSLLNQLQTIVYWNRNCPGCDRYITISVFVYWKQTGVAVRSLSPWPRRTWFESRMAQSPMAAVSCVPFSLLFCSSVKMYDDDWGVVWAIEKSVRSICIKSAAAAAAAAALVCCYTAVSLQQQCWCFLLLFVIVCRMVKFGCWFIQSNLCFISLASNALIFYSTLDSTTNVVSHLRPRFVYILVRFVAGWMDLISRVFSSLHSNVIFLWYP